MARSSSDMANVLMDMYRENSKKRFRMDQDRFKKIAGKARLRSAYISEVDAALREDGFTLIDLRDEEDSLAIVKIATILKFDLIADVDAIEAVSDVAVDPQQCERLLGRTHDGPIALASHDDRHSGLCHGVSSGMGGLRGIPTNYSQTTHKLHISRDAGER